MASGPSLAALSLNWSSAGLGRNTVMHPRTRELGMFGHLGLKEHCGFAGSILRQAAARGTQRALPNPQARSRWSARADRRSLERFMIVLQWPPLAQCTEKLPRWESPRWAGKGSTRGLLAPLCVRPEVRIFLSRSRAAVRVRVIVPRLRRSLGVLFDGQHLPAGKLS